MTWLNLFVARVWSFRLTRPPSRRCRAGGLVIHLIRNADQMNGAACVTRTRDPVITNDVLYQLS